MKTLVVVLGTCIGLALSARHWAGERRKLNKLFAYGFPDYLADEVAKAYPHLSPDDCAQVLDGLRQFFAVAIRARGQGISMPSQAVDEAWHAFILSTQAYADFCRDVLGRFLHHRPAAAMLSARQAQAGIRRTWKLACNEAGISPERPDRLPLLFALDGDLAIPDGFIYSLRCLRGDGTYCAGHIAANSSGCGSGGCGGHGCSGHGCSGGCGGH